MPQDSRAWGLSGVDGTRPRRSLRTRTLLQCLPSNLSAGLGKWLAVGPGLGICMGYRWPRRLSPAVSPAARVAGTMVMQEYHRLRPVRRWLRQLTMDYSEWELATARLCNENVVTTVYMRWNHHKASHRVTVHDQGGRVRMLYGFE